MKLADIPFIKESPWTVSQLKDIIPDGWFSIFEKSLGAIADYLAAKDFPMSKIHITDIKEKYGELRIYAGYEADVTDEEMDIVENAFDEISRLTRRACCECGRSAEYVSRGYILPFCRDCATKRNNEANSRHKTRTAFDHAFMAIDDTSH